MTERDALAAELALGLLEGSDLLAARGLVASDPAFAALVADWESKLAPLLDEVAPVEPGAALWPRIEAALASAPDSTVIALQRKVRRWQWAAGLSAAAALALTIFAAPVLFAPKPVAVEAAPLVASFTLPSTEARLGLTYLPERAELVVTAAGLSADGVHDHELWLVPPAGATISLGVVAPGQAKRVRLPEALAKQLHDGSTLALTREPLGGSAGRPAGPIVATTKFFTT
jgi:anti-sigma-K factor RskA